MPSNQNHYTVRPPRRWVWLYAAGVLVLFCLLPLSGGRAAADGRSAMPVEIATKLQKRGDLSLTNTTLQQALFTIGETWGINIVIGSDVQGNVNGVFKNAPLHEILDSVLLANGYSYRPVGQGLVVMKVEALGELNPMFESATITLRSVKPEDVLPGCQLLASPKGKVLAVPSARSLLVVDFPDRVAAMRKFSQPLDEAASAASSPVSEEPNQPQVAQFQLYNVKVAGLKDSLSAMLSKDGKLATIESENKVVIVDYVPTLRLVEQAIRKMDVARPQVRIRAFIYDVSIEDLENMGINWNHAIKSNDVNATTGLPNSKFAIDSLQIVPAASGTVGGAMTFMNLSQNFDITAVVNMLNSAKDSRLLADPMVTVMEREEASIQIVQEIPYQQLTQTQQGGNIGTTAFREAGVTLKVTPTISPDGTVTMIVTPSFSRLAGFTKDGSAQPIIDRREAKTTVRVTDRQTFAVGGLRQRQDTGEYSGVPYLKDVKVLGKLFQSRSNTVRESELLVFITPEIVGPTHPGLPREQLGAYEAGCLLDQVPAAGGTPFPHCPCPPGPIYGPNIPGGAPAAIPPGEELNPPAGATSQPPAIPSPSNADAARSHSQFDRRVIVPPAGPPLDRPLDRPLPPPGGSAAARRPSPPVVSGIAPVAPGFSSQPASAPGSETAPPAVRVDLSARAAPPGSGPPVAQWLSDRGVGDPNVSSASFAPAPAAPPRPELFRLPPTSQEAGQVRQPFPTSAPVAPSTGSGGSFRLPPSDPVEVRPQPMWQQPAAKPDPKAAGSAAAGNSDWIQKILR